MGTMGVSRGEAARNRRMIRNVEEERYLVLDEKKVWKILGIEKTSDEEAIREAYREALLHTNPEDDPEGFKALREAYERAVDIAAHGDDGNEPVPKEETPIGILIGKIVQILNIV